MSRREIGRRTLMSTPYRLTTLQEAAARVGRDSDDDEGRDVEGTLRRIRRAAEVEEQLATQNRNNEPTSGGSSGSGSSERRLGWYESSLDHPTSSAFVSVQRRTTATTSNRLYAIHTTATASGTTGGPNGRRGRCDIS